MMHWLFDNISIVIKMSGVNTG